MWDLRDLLFQHWLRTIEAMANARTDADFEGASRAFAAAELYVDGRL